MANKDLEKFVDIINTLDVAVKNSRIRIDENINKIYNENDYRFIEGAEYILHKIRHELYLYEIQKSAKNE